MTKQFCTWELVREWRSSVVKSLEDSWQLLEAFYEQEGTNRDEVYGLTLFQRGDETFNNPVEAFWYCMQSGMYPPPEILLAISETHGKYIDSKGKISLDELLFGTGKQKAGNYANQAQKRIRDLRIVMDINGLRAEGKTVAKATQIVSSRENLKEITVFEGTPCTDRQHPLLHLLKFLDFHSIPSIRH